MWGTLNSRMNAHRVFGRLVGILVVVNWISSVNASCFPAIFNFGDSQSDTGGIQASFPGFTPAEYPPYGETYFHSPQYRYCDGRLLIDFLAEGLGHPFLDPYLQSVTSDFRHGANFATAGATVQKVTYLSPFYLGIQLSQFLMFRKGVLEMRNKDRESWGRSSTDVRISGHQEKLNRLPEVEYFGQALYTFAIGGNDYTYGYTQMKSISQVKEYLPDVANGIVETIKRIHDEAGGRHFLVWDMEPQGCLPYMKTLIKHTPDDLDELQCLPEYNEAARFLNNLLNSSMEELRNMWPDSTVVMLSTYEMKMDVFRDPDHRGFKSVYKACCGVPNDYHYDLRIPCGQSNTFDNVTLHSETCDDPNEFVVWDGVHSTEAFNRYQAKQIFSGKYFYPAFPKLTEGCDLSPVS